MKIIQVHNYYRFRGGECLAFEATVNLLKSRGMEVYTLTRDSHGLDNSLWNKLCSFGSGFYSQNAEKDMTQLLQTVKPDIVHIHNLYPLLSPSVIASCRRCRIPIVMTCHNYRLICPIGTHVRNDRICEMCSYRKEYWCFLKNCRNNVLESFTYAMRSVWARRSRVFHTGITLFIALTAFQKQKLLIAGIDGNRIVVVPQITRSSNVTTDLPKGNCVAYVGRISREKGVSTVFSAAEILPQVPFRMAGESSGMADGFTRVPTNVDFTGWLDKYELDTFYRHASLLVLPSLCYEVFPLVILEAMSYGLPIVASRIGGLPEIVDEGLTGYLFEPGNPNDLATKINVLWENPQLCRKMGQAAREKFLREFSEDQYYDRLLMVYNQAIEINKQNIYLKSRR